MELLSDLRKGGFCKMCHFEDSLDRNLEFVLDEKERQFVDSAFMEFEKVNGSD